MLSNNIKEQIKALIPSHWEFEIEDNKDVAITFKNIPKEEYLELYYNSKNDVVCPETVTIYREEMALALDNFLKTEKYHDHYFGFFVGDNKFKNAQRLRQWYDATSKICQLVLAIGELANKENLYNVETGEELYRTSISFVFYNEDYFKE